MLMVGVVKTESWKYGYWSSTYSAQRFVRYWALQWGVYFSSSRSSSILIYIVSCSCNFLAFQKSFPTLFLYSCKVWWLLVASLVMSSIGLCHGWCISWRSSRLTAHPGVLVYNLWVLWDVSPRARSILLGAYICLETASLIAVAKTAMEMWREANQQFAATPYWLFRL
jgi:hypothetical protein